MSVPKIISCQSVHFGSIKEIYLSPDEKSILSIGSEDGMIIESSLSDLSDIKDHKLLSLSNGLILSFFSDINKKELLFCSDAEMGIQTATWPECHSTQFVSSLTPYSMIQVSMDGRYVAVTGQDPAINVINYLSKDICEIFDNTCNVLLLQFSPNSQYILSYNEENILYIFNVDSGQLILEKTISSNMKAIKWISDSKLVYSITDDDGMLNILDINTKNIISHQILEHASPIIGIVVCSDENIITIDQKNKVIFSEFESLSQQPRQHTIFQYSITDIIDEVTCFQYQSPYLFIGSDIGHIQLWEFQIKKLIAEQHIGEPEDIDLDFGDEINNEKTELLKLKSLSFSKPKIVKSKEMGKPKIVTKKKKSKIIPFDDEIVDFDNLPEEEDFSDSDRGDTSLKGYRKYISKMAEESSGTMLSDEISDNSDSDILKNQNMTRDKLNDEEKSRRYAEYQNMYALGSNSPSSSTSESDEPYYSDSKKPKTRFEKELEMARKEHKSLKGKTDAIDPDISYIEEVDQQTIEEEDLDEITSSSGVSDYEYSSDEQETSFMPGSMFNFIDNRKYLCWNQYGAIFMRKNTDDDDIVFIDTEFYDQFSNHSYHKKNDMNFVMASMNQIGFVGASRTTVQYRLHKNGEILFTQKFDSHETIDLIAIGDGWIAVSTEIRRLHIFELTGLEIAVLSLPSRLITMVGTSSRLLLVWEEDKKMFYGYFDVQYRQMISQGRLPKMARVDWICIDDELNSYVLSSDKILFQLVHDFGFHWMPMVDIQQEPSITTQSSDDSEFDKYLKTLEDQTIDLPAVNSSETHLFHCAYIQGNNIYGSWTSNNETISTTTLPHLDTLPLKPISIEPNTSDRLLKRSKFLNSDIQNQSNTLYEYEQQLIKSFSMAISDRKISQAMQIGMFIRSSRARAIAKSVSQMSKNPRFIQNLEKYYESHPIIEENGEYSDYEPGYSSYEDTSENPQDADISDNADSEKTLIFENDSYIAESGQINLSNNQENSPDISPTKDHQNDSSNVEEEEYEIVNVEEEDIEDDSIADSC